MSKQSLAATTNLKLLLGFGGGSLDFIKHPEYHNSTFKLVFVLGTRFPVWFLEIWQQTNIYSCSLCLTGVCNDVCCVCLFGFKNSGDSKWAVKFRTPTPLRSQPKISPFELFPQRRITSTLGNERRITSTFYFMEKPKEDHIHFGLQGGLHPLSFIFCLPHPYRGRGDPTKAHG